MSRKWTLDEDCTLRRMFQTASWGDITARIHRSQTAISCRAYKVLGLSRVERDPDLVMHAEAWSTEEVQFLIQSYPAMPWNDMVYRLKRSEYAIRSKANVIGVRRARALQTKRRISAPPRRDPSIVRTVVRMEGKRSYREIADACMISRGAVAGILRDYRGRV